MFALKSQTTLCVALSLWANIHIRTLVTSDNRDPSEETQRRPQQFDPRLQLNAATGDAELRSCGAAQLSMLSVAKECQGDKVSFAPVDLHLR